MNEEKNLNEMYDEIIEDVIFQESIMSKFRKLGKKKDDKIQKVVKDKDTKIEKLVRDKDDAVAITKMWERSKKFSKRKEWESNQVDDDTFEKIKEELNTCRTCTSYFVYKNSFDKLCKLCHIPTGNGVVLMDVKLKKGRHDKNSVVATWADGRYKIQIPHGSILYHRSPKSDLHELTPVVRGKDARGFMYDTPRVYMTIKAHLPKLAADIYHGDSYMYIVDENIKYAYVDPLLRSSMFGAVYVDTKQPIKVKKLTPQIMEKIKKRYE